MGLVSAELVGRNFVCVLQGLGGDAFPVRVGEVFRVIPAASARGETQGSNGNHSGQRQYAERVHR